MDETSSDVDATANESSSHANMLEMPMDRKDYSLGIALLLLVVFLWTSSNFLTQDLFKDGYEKPFLVTYLNTSAFACYLVPWLIRKSLGFKNATLQDPVRQGYETIAVSDALDVPTSPLRSNIRSPSTLVEPLPSLSQSPEKLPPLTSQETAKLASVFCLFWFVANWSVNASLDYTSVASATILSSMSGFFTMAVGRIFKVETMTLAKICAVVTSFLGVILVSMSDSASTPVTQNPTPSHAFMASPLTPVPTHPRNPILGDALALLSAIFYALYVILLKVQIKEESRIDMQLFFGFVGLFNVLLFWPVGVLLHFTGVETLEWPHTRKAWAAVLINMAITLCSDYVYVLAMLKTTPLVVTVGISLTIPLAIFGDFVLGVPTATQAVYGAVLVLISFVVIGVENSRSGTAGTAEVKNEDVENRPSNSGSLEDHGDA